MKGEEFRAHREALAAARGEQRVRQINQFAYNLIRDRWAGVVGSLGWAGGFRVGLPARRLGKREAGRAAGGVAARLPARSQPARPSGLT